MNWNVIRPVGRFIKAWSLPLFFGPKLKRTVPVLVYQMGKVGSSSIYASLLKQYPGVVLHSHLFSRDNKDSKIRYLYQWVMSKSKPLKIITLGLSCKCNNFQWVMSKSKPLKIITLTREPVGRNVSAFFQNFERETGVPYARSSFSIEELKGHFLSNYDHEIPLKWFDKHVLANFGVDVFATPFPENGVCTYSENNVEILIMRVEIDDDLKAVAVADFLGLAGFELNNINIGEAKDYSVTYKAFKQEVKLPVDYIDRMCDSKYFNHFYGKQVISATRKRWSESNDY